MVNENVLLKKAIKALKGSRCIFWACPGPDEPFESMKTCSICYALQCLRQIKLPGKGCLIG